MYAAYASPSSNAHEVPVKGLPPSVAPDSNRCDPDVAIVDQQDQRSRHSASRGILPPSSYLVRSVTHS